MMTEAHEQNKNAMTTQQKSQFRLFQMELKLDELRRKMINKLEGEANHACIVADQEHESNIVLNNILDKLRDLLEQQLDDGTNAELDAVSDEE
jgi:hypothetical protein